MSATLSWVNLYLFIKQILFICLILFIKFIFTLSFIYVLLLNILPIVILVVSEAYYISTISLINMPTVYNALHCVLYYILGGVALFLIGAYSYTIIYIFTTTFF